MILVPNDEDGLRAAIAEAHRRYTRLINGRKGWTGYLWQGRFASFPMDEGHTLAAARYIEQNPVRARLVSKPQDWRWSSAKAHLRGRDDGLVTVKPMLKRVGNWAAFLRDSLDEETLESIRSGERTGRPRGSAAFIKRLENALGRTLAKRKPGPKPAQ
jgi:putative transposase